MPYPVVLAVLFVRALGGAFHAPAMLASTSLMVPEQHLTRIQGLNQGLQGLLNIVAAPLGAFLLACVVLYQKIYGNFPINRNPLFMLTAVLGLMSIQFLLMGLLAEMMARTYHESQSKPTYVVRQIFESDRSGNLDIWVRQADGTGEARLLVGGPEDQGHLIGSRADVSQLHLARQRA